MLQVLDLIANESSKSIGLFNVIAYVDLNAGENSMKFIENASVNRSLPVRVFSSVADAEQWLLNKSR